MIKKLRCKFILVTMCCLILIVSAILGTIYLVTALRNKESLLNRMEKVINTDGIILILQKSGKTNHKEAKHVQDFNDRTFAVKIDTSGNVIKILGHYPEELEEEELSQLIHTTCRSSKNQGSMNDYQFMKAEKNYGTILVLTDYSIENYYMTDLFRICLAVGIIGIIALFFIAVLLSYWSIRPVEEAIEKQKVFIANASHELRTPLTVIYANTELLQKQLGENKWLEYIKGNAEHMIHMVNDLLSLTRLDHNKFNVTFNRFNISKAVLNTALSMESLAYEKDKTLEINIKEDIYYTGDIETIKQLTAILLDNAIKYSDENGCIRLSFKELNRKPILEIYNTGTGIPKEHIDKIFDRFYRLENSGSGANTGCGLGLSIAWSIVKLHKGKIRIESEESQGVNVIVKL